MIFNKANQGSEELFNLLEFVAKGISFERLKPYLISCEDDLRGIVSPGVWVASEEFYQSEQYLPITDWLPDAKNKFVIHLQMANAVLAYRMYADNADLSHDASGGEYKKEANTI